MTCGELYRIPVALSSFICLASRIRDTEHTHDRVFAVTKYLLPPLSSIRIPNWKKRARSRLPKIKVSELQTHGLFRGYLFETTNEYVY